MAVQVDDGAGSPAARADDVHARMPCGVLGAALGGDVLDAERAALEIPAEEARAGVVCLPRRVHGRNAHEVGREVDDLIGGAIHLRKNALDGLHGRSVSTISQ